MRSRLLIFTFILSTFLFSSCEKKPVVRFLNFKPEVNSYYEELAQIYKEQTGIDVIVETAANGVYQQTLIAKMTSPDFPVLFQINGVKALDQWGEFCEDLSDSKLAEHVMDKSLLLKNGNQIAAIPYVIEGYGIIYNKALTDKYFALSEKAVPFSSMDEINTFEKLKSICDDMQKNKEKLGIKGVFASTSLKNGEDWRWQTHLANIPLYYEFKNENYDLSAGHIDEIQFTYDINFKNIFDLYLTDSVIPPQNTGLKTVTDSMAEFAMENCVMVQNGNWAWKQISSTNGNKVKEENIRFLPIYTGIAGEETQGLCVGTENYFVINSYASEVDIQAAKDFIWWLFSDETAKKYVTEKLGFITPFDTFDVDQVPSDPLAEEIYRWMSKKNCTSVSWDFTFIPSEKFKQDFGSSLLKYAQGNKPWSKVRSDFIEKWSFEAQQSKSE